jgi:hypothetical protein
MFFFEKKNQKTFIRLLDGQRPGKRMKVFLLLFLQKKKILASLDSSGAKNHAA